MTAGASAAMTDPRLVELVAEIADVAPVRIQPDARLVEDLGFDSIALMELMVALSLDDERVAVVLEMRWEGITVRELERFVSGSG